VSHACWYHSPKDHGTYLARIYMFIAGVCISDERCHHTPHRFLFGEKTYPRCVLVDTDPYSRTTNPDCGCPPSPEKCLKLQSTRGVILIPISTHESLSDVITDIFPRTGIRSLCTPSPSRQAHANHRHTSSVHSSIPFPSWRYLLCSLTVPIYAIALPRGCPNRSLGYSHLWAY
jgi:hypothetical protein